ncbi:MAG TPA: hypothetical protein VFN78_08475 [Ktedonobacterales bacterium]|nr:hypothetical protein [Ktedonobacterales bacterium]
MRIRAALGGVFVALSLVISVFAATPAHAAPATVSVNPHIVQKLTLPQTSIDGPALWTSDTGTIRGEIAYTGTDPAHRLNVMTSADGIHYSDKRILSETSFARPALVRFGSNSGDGIALAWTGNDRNHSLNVFVGNPGFGYTKLTLKDYSPTAPALVWNGAYLYLAWVGVDANHSLNVARIVWRGGMYLDKKVTMRDLHSAGRPSLTWDPNTSQYLLSWPVTGTNRIAFATATDGLNYTVAAASPLAEWTYSGPHMIGFPVNNMPRHFLAWTGIDPSHRLNAQFTESFPRWPDAAATKTTFDEQAVGGPALGYVGVYNRVLLAWTGVDAAHHINVAVLSVGV